MPRSTARHTYEFKVWGWARRFRDESGFLAVLDEGGAIAKVHEADTTSFGTPVVSHEIKQRVTAENARWIFYDPFDAPEYAWLSWQGVPRAIMERLIGDKLDEEDVPESWGVMF